MKNISSSGPTRERRAGWFTTGAQGVDTFLTTLVNDQLTVWDATANATTGQHSVLAYSLSSRGLPWEFTV